MGRNYYIFKGSKIKREQNTIVVDTDKDRKFLPINDVEQIFIFSEVNFNTSFLNFISQNNILVHFFNYYGYYIGSFLPRGKYLSGALTVKQVQFYLDSQKRLDIAKLFVQAAFHNMKRNIEKRENTDEDVYNMQNYISKLNSVENINDLMLIEANFKKSYYSVIEKLTSWEFENRSIRPPKNPLNAIISFGNSLVYAEVLKNIYHTALNPTVSYLHEPSERRFSLALDIAEIFKPILCDKLILRMINLNIIKQEHFMKELNFCYLTEEGKKIFVKNFEEQLEQTIFHRGLGRKVKYKNLIILELYKIIKHIVEDKKYSPLKVWW